jgi:hypothetical protein
MNITTQKTILVRCAQLFLGTISLAIAIDAVAVDTNTIPGAGDSHGATVTSDEYKMFVSGDYYSSAALMNTTTDKTAQSIAVNKSMHAVSDKQPSNGNSGRTPYISDGYEGYPDRPFYSDSRE